MTYTFRILLQGSFLLSILLVSGCGAGTADQRPPKERLQPVEVAPVTVRNLTESLLVVGSVAANESTEVRAEIPGLIRNIHFQEGQNVEEGQVLVQLDDRELKAQLREATVRFELAKQTFERSDALAASQSVSVSERDRALAEYERTRAERDLLEVRMEKSVIRAPFAGLIGARAVSPGDLLETSTSIARLEDLSRLKVEFSLPDRHADRIEPGSPILLSAGEGTGQTTFPGTVYFVSPAIDRATRALQVKAYVEDPPATLRPGMFAQVEVILEEKEAVFTVPETAILAREGSHFVVVVEQDEEGGEVIDFRPVRLGLRQKGIVEVTPVGDTALNEGEQVVAAGVGALPLFPGARVESRPAKESFTQASRS